MGTLSCLAFPFRQPRRYLMIAARTDRGDLGRQYHRGIDFSVSMGARTSRTAAPTAVIFLAASVALRDPAVPHPCSGACATSTSGTALDPVFGWGIYLCGMIPINRARGKEALDRVAEIGGRKLRDGWYMILFPEGTRRLGHKRRYKQAVPIFRGHRRAGGADRAQRRRRAAARQAGFKKPGTVHVWIGAPIPPAGHTADSQMTEVERWDRRRDAAPLPASVRPREAQGAARPAAA